MSPESPVRHRIIINEDRGKDFEKIYMDEELEDTGDLI